MDDTTTLIMAVERHIADCEDRIAPLLTLLAGLDLRSASGTRAALVAEIRRIIDDLHHTRQHLAFLREQA